MAIDSSISAASQQNVARLAEIDFEKLITGNEQSLQALLNAAQADGFFYLDLKNDAGNRYLELTAELLYQAEGYFARPLQDKMIDRRANDIESRTAGYKPIALETGVERDTKDGFEAFKVTLPIIHKLGANSSKIPTDVFYWQRSVSEASFIERISSDVPMVESFARQSHRISNVLMTALWTALGPATLASFSSHHSIDLPSSSATVINYYPLTSLPEGSSIGHNAHTDLGSITLLYCNNWGLQVYSAENSSWLFVEPKEGKAIVNVGDALRFLSNNRVRSCLHRVIPHPEWKTASRLSLAYFTRPNTNTKLVDGDGNIWQVEDWVARKFQSYKESHSQQEKSGIQIGRKGLPGSIAR